LLTVLKRKFWIKELVLGVYQALEILFYSLVHFDENRDINMAASIAFYAILSTVPMLVLSALVVGTFFDLDPSLQGKIEHLALQLHPNFPVEILNEFEYDPDKVQVIGWIGLISLIWVSSMFFHAIEISMGLIFSSGKERIYVFSKLLAIAMIPLFWVVASVYLLIDYFYELIQMGILRSSDNLLIAVFAHTTFFHHLLPYVTLAIFMTMVYKLVPVIKVSLWQAIFASLLFSSLVELAQWGFAWYVGENPNYHIVYGSVAAFISIVLWVFYVAVILLFCAELISTWQRRDLILLKKLFLKRGFIRHEAG
jgi:membrane protein